MSAVQKVEYISVRMSCVKQGEYCYNIIVRNVHALTEDKGDDTKDSFVRNCIGSVPEVPQEILTGDFNAKVDREDMFKPTPGNKNLHEISNDNGVRIVNCATSRI
jgi:hypothetical protein